MRRIRIETQGLTIKEGIELEGVVRGLKGVDDVKFTPFLPGTVHNRSLATPQMAIGAFHLLVHLVECAAGGVSVAVGQHFYKKVGEGIVDGAWGAIKGRFSGTSRNEVAITLYGPDGELIKQHKGRR